MNIKAYSFYLAGRLPWWPCLPHWKTLRTYVIIGNKWSGSSVLECYFYYLCDVTFIAAFRPQILLFLNTLVFWEERSGQQSSVMEAVIHPTGGHCQKEIRSQTFIKFHIKMIRISWLQRSIFKCDQWKLTQKWICLKFKIWSYQPVWKESRSEIFGKISEQRTF